MTKLPQKQQCPRCKKFLNLESYTKSNQGVKGSYCQLCTKEYNAVRSRRLWEEKLASPDYVPKKRGRKADPLTPLRQAVRKAQKNEQRALAQEIREVKRGMAETSEGKLKFKAQCQKLNLDFEEVWTAYTSGNKCCEICGTPGNGQGLAIDHDHVSGKFRGFLCSVCNMALGVLGDNAEGIQKVMAYLQKI